MDQPIFALGKQLQWTMSDIYGEDRYCYDGWFTHRDGFIEDDWPVAGGNIHQFRQTSQPLEGEMQLTKSLRGGNCA